MSLSDAVNAFSQRTARPKSRAAPTIGGVLRMRGGDIHDVDRVVGEEVVDGTVGALDAELGGEGLAHAAPSAN